MLTKIWYFYILFIILEQFITLKIRSSKEHQQNLHCCSLSLDTIIILYYYYCLFIYYYFLFVYFFCSSHIILLQLKFLEFVSPLSTLREPSSGGSKRGAGDPHPLFDFFKKMIDCIC